MLKKILSVILLAFCFAIGMNFADESKANAEFIYAFSYNGTDYYIDSLHGVPYENEYVTRFWCYYNGQLTPGVGYFTGIILAQNPIYKEKWTCEIHLADDYRIRINDISNAGVYQNMVNSCFNIYQKLWRERLARIEQIERQQAEEKRLAEEKRRREEAERKRIADEKERIFNNLIAEGDKFYNAKNYDSAKNSYAKARTENSSKVENYCNELIKKGDSLSNEKNFAAAIDYFRKALVMGSSKAGDGLYKSLVEAGGVAAFSNKKFDEAINLLNEAINFQPNNSWAYNVLGIAYKDMGEYNKAIENYNKALQISPNYKYVYGNRGYCYRILKNYDSAISDYKKALSLDSNYSNADSGLWAAYCESKKFDEAVGYYSSKIAKNKADSLSYFRLGYSYNELKDYQNAVKNYEQAIKLNPTANTYYNLGISYQNLGNNKKAVEAYSKIFENVKGSEKYADDSELQYKIAVAYDDLKNYPKAIEYYQKVIELNKKYIDKYIGDENIKFEDERVITYEDGNGGFEIVENYTTVSDNQKNYRGRLGRIYFRQKNYTEALKYFDEAIDKFGEFFIGDAINDENSYKGDNDIYWLRGQCHENLKQYEKALADYKKALELDKDNKKIQDAEKRVSKLLGKK